MANINKSERVPKPMETTFNTMSRLPMPSVERIWIVQAVLLVTWGA